MGNEDTAVVVVIILVVGIIAVTATSQKQPTTNSSFSSSNCHHQNQQSTNATAICLKGIKREAVWVDHHQKKEGRNDEELTLAGKSGRQTSTIHT